MKAAEYFPELYLKDHALFGNGVLCSRTLSKYQDEAARSDFANFEYYCICSYELNLLSQAVHAHFNDDHEAWMRETVPYVDCRCDHRGGHPVSILENVIITTRKSDHPITFRKDIILSFDKLFLKYFKDVCRDNTFVSLTFDGLVSVIQSDSDCVGEKVSFLNRLK